MEDLHNLIGAIFSVSEKTDFEKTLDEIEEEEYKKAAGEALIEKKPMPRKRGRPTVVTKEVLRDLRMAFLMGCSDNEAVAFAGISRAVFYDYKAKTPEFSDYVDLWKEEPVLKAKATLFKSLDNPDTAQWYLERKKREEFAMRKELTGPDGGNIGLTLDRLETDYGNVAAKAGDELGQALTGQVVEADPPIQNKE